MKKNLLKITVISFLFIGSIMGQTNKSVEGKTFILGEYTWEFKADGNVTAYGGLAGDGTDGKYIQKENDVFIVTDQYRIFGSFDGEEFKITGSEEIVESSANNKSIDYNQVRIKEFKIALQCYTYRKFSFMETLDKANEMGIKYVQAYPGQKLNKDGSAVFDVNMTKDELAMVDKRLNELGITVIQFGVAGIADENTVRKLFEFAKELGIATVTIEPPFELLPMVDELANQYKINVAIHNHPPPSRYWHPGITYFHISTLSSRMGICGDTGHWTRSGVNPATALRLFKGRIFDVHLKDLNEFGNMEAYDVPFGEGESNIRDILAELSMQNYRGALTIEHEKEDDAMNPMPPIVKGLEYIKKVSYYEGYKEILGFNGNNYSKHGWNHYGPGYFELDQESGILTSSGGMGLLWYSIQQYDDFVLDLDYMCHSPSTNSGVFLRIPHNIVLSNDYIYKSFEIQIQPADTLTKHTNGAVFDAEPAKLIASNPIGEWNHYRISFIDKRIKVELNGQLINNWLAEPRGKIKSFAKKGYIGLQNHDSEGKVSFKNIFIKEF